MNTTQDLLRKALEALSIGRYYTAAAASQFIRESGINASPRDDKDVAKIDAAIESIRTALSSPADQPGCVRAAEAVQPVKRYDMGYFQGAPAMFEQPNGKYVRYEDSVQPIWFDEMREINGMTEAQIDAELIAHGISPADAVQRAQAAINDAVTQAARHGTVQCPLCGKTYAHEHSPEEVQIFRNGVKRGAAPLPQGDGADAKDAASDRCARPGCDKRTAGPVLAFCKDHSAPPVPYA